MPRDVEDVAPAGVPGRWSKWALQQGPGRGHAEHLVLFGLAMFATEDGLARPTVHELAAAVAVAESTTRSALVGFARQRLVTRSPLRRGSSGDGALQYQYRLGDAGERRSVAGWSEMRWAFQQARQLQLTKRAARLLLGIAVHANQAGEARPGPSTLQRYLAMSEKTLDRARTELRGHGILETKVHGKANRYQLVQRPRLEPPVTEQPLFVDGELEATADHGGASALLGCVTAADGGAPHGHGGTSTAGHGGAEVPGEAPQEEPRRTAQTDSRADDPPALAEVLDVLAQSDRLYVDRVGLVNAILSWPHTDHVLGARGVIAAVTDPSFRHTNAALLLSRELEHLERAATRRGRAAPHRATSESERVSARRAEALRAMAGLEEAIG